MQVTPPAKSEQRTPERSVNRCMRCEYSLTGIEVTRCPECGANIPSDEQWDHIVDLAACGRRWALAAICGLLLCALVGDAVLEHIPYALLFVLPVGAIAIGIAPKAVDAGSLGSAVRVFGSIGLLIACIAVLICLSAPGYRVVSWASAMPALILGSLAVGWTVRSLSARSAILNSRREK